MQNRKQELINAMLHDKCKLTILSDLDFTLCDMYSKDYPMLNSDGAFISPVARKALGRLKENGANVCFVTGRNWANTRFDDVKGEYVPDGALYDLLGGENSEFADYKAICGHGMFYIHDGQKELTVKMSDKEQAFAKYAGESIEGIIKELYAKFPDIKGNMEAGYKEHLSFINIHRYKHNPNYDNAYELVSNRMNVIMTKSSGGFKYIEEVGGSMEIRFAGFDKGRGIEYSKILDEALKNNHIVMVMGDSLGEGGTDVDMFKYAHEYFSSNNVRERLFLIQVLNGKNAVADKISPCYPDITVENPDDLGDLLMCLTELAS